MSTFSSVLNIRHSVVRILGATLAATIGALSIQALPAQAATATINNVSFKAPVFDSYNHATGGGAWNDGSVTYDKGELLGTNYKCGDIATFLLELNVSATPTKQPAPYKAQVSIDYTWDSTGATGASLTALSSTDHLKVNTGQILKTYNGGTSVLGTGTGGTDGGMNTSGALASVATSPAPVVTPTGTEFGGNSSTSNVTFTVQNILAGANIVVRSDAVIHCKPNSSPTGNLQAALMSVKVTDPGATEVTSTGNQTVNFRGVGNLAGLGSILTVTKSVSTNGTDCTSTVASASYTGAPQTPLYCYTVTNTGSSDVSNIVLKDDNATPGNTADDVTVPLKVGSASATSPVTLLVGQSATGTYSRTYSAAGSYTNIATVTSTAPTVTASALVTIASSTPGLSLIKTQTSSNPSAVGDIVTYDLTLVNTVGNNSPTTVTDSNASSLTCGASSATAPTGTYGVSISGVQVSNTVNATFTCTATHIVSAADVTAGTITNSFTGLKQSTTYTSNSVTTPIIPRALVYDMSIVKTQTSTNLPAAANDTIVYNILVTNTGTGALTNVSLVDNLSNTALTNCKYQSSGTPSVTLPIATFAVGASFACTATHTVQAGEVNTSVINTATASATQTLQSTNTTSVSSSVTTPVGAQPHMSVLKIQATGNPPARLGAVLTYGISYFNDGNVTLTNVHVTDPNATLSNCKVGATTWVDLGSLMAGTKIDCDASHTVTQGDLDAGSITNIAYMDANYNSIPMTQVHSDNIISVGALSITKTRTDNLGVNLVAGSIMTYSILVTNTGNLALTGVTIGEVAGFNVSCPATTIAIGASLTCTVTHSVTAAEVTAHQVVNTASVTSDQTDRANSNTVTSPIAALTIVKTRTDNLGTALESTTPSVVTYSIVVTNTGAVVLHNVQVTDANATLGTCTPSTPVDLAIGASITCTASHSVTTGDESAHQVVNTATVTSTEIPSTNSNTVTSPIAQAGSFLTIVKSRTDSLGSNLHTGDIVTFSVVVTNTGTTALNNVVVTDAYAIMSTCSATSLAAGATLTCSASHTITSTEATSTYTYSNTAHVTSTEIANTDSNTVVVPISALSIVKTRTDSLSSSLVEGSVVTYNIVVTNLGQTSLTGVVIHDGNAVVSCPSGIGVLGNPATIAIGGSLTCTASHTVTAAEVTSHQVVNTASVISNEIPSTNSNTVTSPIAELTITKSRVGSTAITAAGDVVTYSILVTNTGGVTLHNVQVTDGNATLGTCTPALPVSLAIGATVTCSATHSVTPTEVTNGHVLNTATVTSTEVSSTNSNQVDTPVNPATPPAPQPNLSIAKALVGTAPTKVGGTITYSITVTNTGDVALSNVVISDVNATLISCAATTLATGASFTCTATHVVTDADMAAGQVDNTAVASSSTGSLSRTSNLVTVPLTPAPAITIVKSLSGAAPSKVGDTIAYNIVVTNAGNVTVTNLTVADANATLGTCTPAAPATLAPAASITCAATHVITDADMTAGKVDNVATASGTAAGAPVSGSGSGTNGSLNVTSNVVTVPLVRNPAITIVKSVTGAMPTDIGGYVHYTIVVTNSGNVTLHDVQVFDDNATITGCSPATPAATLLVGASITCSARHAVTADDALAGKIINVAYAKTAENVTASSGTSGSVTGGNGSSTPSNAAPGTVKANSNETVVLIKFKGRGFGTGSGNTVVLGAAALKNPKLSQLAFTGDDEPLTSDFGFFLTLMAAIALLLGARRIARR